MVSTILATSILLSRALLIIGVATVLGNLILEN